LARRRGSCILALDALSAGAALTPALKKGGEGENSFASLNYHSSIAPSMLLDGIPILLLLQSHVYYTHTIRLPDDRTELKMDTEEIPPVVQCDLTSADYEEILALWRRAGLTVRPDGRDAPAAFARQLAGGLQRVVGLRVGNELVAVAVLTHDGRKGWINRLAVARTHRRQGLARRLIGEVERRLSRLGIEIFACLIEEGNSVSMEVFERLGYKRHPEIVYFTKRKSEET